MLKQILTACAAVVLSGSISLAGDLSATFTGQGNGQSVTVTLQSRGGEVHGTVATGGANFPLVGRESDGSVEGIWRAPNGQDVPFLARTNGSELQLQTNGATYSLSTSTNQDASHTAPAVIRSDREDSRARPNAVPQQQAVAQAVGNVEMCQSQVFAFPVPQGWQHNESPNAVFVYTPDASATIGFTGMERINTGTPIQFLHFMMEKVHDIPLTQVLDCKPIEYPGGTGIECAWLTRRANGSVCKSWARCVVVQGYGSNGYILLASAPADRFDASFATLKALAEKIQITNGDAGFDRQNALAVQRNSNFNHPMDHSFADQYWVNQKRMDGVMARGSDVRTGNYVSSNPTTGAAYDHGVGAFDNTGHVVDPENPNQYLVTRHWEGQ
jgi:hypothetical protein